MKKGEWLDKNMLDYHNTLRGPFKSLGSAVMFFSSTCSYTDRGRELDLAKTVFGQAQWKKSNGGFMQRRVSSDGPGNPKIGGNEDLMSEWRRMKKVIGTVYCGDSDEVTELLKMY